MRTSAFTTAKNKFSRGLTPTLSAIYSPTPTIKRPQDFTPRPHPESAMTDLLLNPRKHGIDAAQLAIHPEEVLEFNQLLEGLHLDMRPNGETQRLLFGQILHATWNMRIARKHEAQALLVSGPASKNVQAITKFYLIYERTFHRAIAELRSLQTEFAYRATLADEEDSSLPDVPPLVRTSEVHKQVRRVAAPATALRHHTLGGS